MDQETSNPFKPDPRIQRQLNQEQNQIHRVEQVALQAMDGISKTHEYATFKATSSLTAVEAWKQSLRTGEMTSEKERLLEQLTENYIRDIARISKEGCEAIVQVVQGVTPAEYREEGFVVDLKDALEEMFGA